MHQLQEENDALSVGSEVHLTADADEILIATTEESYDALLRALAANDQEALIAQLVSGSLFTVSKNTRARILAGSFSRVQVRILEGERAGSSGWVALEFVKP